MRYVALLSIAALCTLGSSGCWFCEEPAEELCCESGICHPCEDGVPVGGGRGGADTCIDCGRDGVPPSDSRTDVPDEPSTPPSNGATCTLAFDCDYDEYCSGGYCAPLPDDACRYDSECAVGSICNSGSCEPEGDFCLTDWECGPGCICQDRYCEPEIGCTPVTGCPDGLTCSPEGACYAPAGTPDPDVCESDYECPLEDRCREGACVPEEPAATAECATNIDCGDDAVCIDAVCHEAFGGSCDSNLDCEGGETCLDSTCCLRDAGSEPSEPTGDWGICQPGIECNGLTSCRDSCYGERCCFLLCNCGNDDELNCSMYCDE